jgi:hypothetical protein
MEIKRLNTFSSELWELKPPKRILQIIPSIFLKSVPGDNAQRDKVIVDGFG